MEVERQSAVLPPVHVAPFVVKDCALVALATGRRAQTLRELRDHLAAVDVGVIYHHFWSRRLRPQFDDLEYHNDFAAWAHHALHDKVLAERLEVVDPADYSSLEELRQHLIDVIEERIDELHGTVPSSRPDQQFIFIRSQIVVFDAGRRVARPDELPDAIARFSPGSLFYHVIDARRRHPEGIDDFRAWLMVYGSRYESLYGELSRIDPYFSSLTELRDQMAAVFRRHLGGGHS